MSRKRIEKELNDIIKAPSSNFTVSANPEDIFQWSIALFGPPDTPYANGLFLITLELPSDYPFKPPKNVNFLTKIYHPNIDNQSRYSPCAGRPNILCLDEWSPAFTVAKVVHQIEGHLIQPNTQCSHNMEAGKMYDHNRKNFDTIAREWTQKYAQ